MPARQGDTLNQYDAGIDGAIAVDISAADAVLTTITRGVYVGVSGDLKVIFAGDVDAAAVTLTGLASGVWHPMQIRTVVKIGTTATNIVAGF
jgi:hypothetical protein